MSKIDKLLLTEQGQARFSHSFFSAAIITGLISWLFNFHAIWTQLNSLLHVLSGVAFTIFVTPYIYYHFKRTVGFRRSGVLFSGLMLAGIIIANAVTGLFLAWHGRIEAMSWIILFHQVSAAVLIGLLFLHILQHWAFFPSHRVKSQLGKFPSFTVQQKKWLLSTAVAIPAAMLLAGLLSPQDLEPTAAEPQVADYQTPYGKHPFRPSQTEVVHGGFVTDHQIADSMSCAGCHQDITEQWLASKHQQAASDPAYEKNIDLLVSNKGIEAARYCEGCHAPVALLTGELSEGGVHGGVAGSSANLEGVSCMSCHGMSNVVHLKGVASYEFSPAVPYLFANSDSALLTSLNHQLIRISPEQHKKDMNHPIVEDPKMCASCHVQFMDKDLNNWGWVQMQNDYKAWAESPFSQHHDESFSDQNYVRCQDCHMPLVQSDDPSANQDGLVRSHFFTGANTFLPLLRGDEEHYLRTKSFLQSNRLRLQIDKPQRDDLLQSQQIIDEQLRITDEVPYFAYLGETVEIDVVITNNGVGHNFPAGTIDINEVWVEFIVTDSTGEKVFTSGLIDGEDNVDPKANFYRSLPIDRQGNLVWKHDLFNMVGESFNRVIPAGESDLLTYQFYVPSSAKSPLTVSAKLNYRKLNAQYAKWALEDLYFPIPVVEIAWDSFSIPVKKRKNVSSLSSR